MLHQEPREELAEVHLWKTWSSFLGIALKWKVASSHCQTAREIRSFPIDFQGNRLHRVNFIYIYVYAYIFLIQNCSFLSTQGECFSAGANCGNLCCSPEGSIEFHRLRTWPRALGILRLKTPKPSEEYYLSEQLALIELSWKISSSQQLSLSAL